MSGIKTKQIESEIQIKLSELIMELDNEAASQATVVEVILNNDNSIAKVYVSFLQDNDETSFFELKKATAFLRRELAHMVSLKKVPFIELILDDNLSRINEMEKLIDKVNKK